MSIGEFPESLSQATLVSREILSREIDPMACHDAEALRNGAQELIRGAGGQAADGPCQRRRADRRTISILRFRISEGLSHA